MLRSLFSSVVFPLPRKPVRMVRGTAVTGWCEGEGFCGEAAPPEVAAPPEGGGVEVGRTARGEAKASPSSAATIPRAPTPKCIGGAQRLAVSS